MQIGILTCSTPNRKWLYEITNRTKEKYAVKNGMHYVFSETFYPDKSRHPYWNKIKMILDYLPKYDWVVWIDDDAGFIRDTSFAEILTKSEKPFLYCTDLNGFNSGVMFVKNTPEMADTFKFIWDRMYFAYKDHQFPEQDALKTIIGKLDLGEEIDGRLYNAYDKRLTISENNQANDNTVILHIAGGSWFKEHHKEEIKHLYESY